MVKFLKGRNPSGNKDSKRTNLERKPFLGESFSSLKKKLSFLKWFDPFTYVDLFVMPRVKRVTKSSAIELVVNVFFAVLFAWIVYTILGIAFGTNSPLVIVYSASMENTFFRGDVMLLSKVSSGDYKGVTVDLNRVIKGVPVFEYLEPSYISFSEIPSSSSGKLDSIYFKDLNKNIYPNKEGYVIVYNSYPFNLPIIHRAIVRINALDGVFFLTKGDNQVTNPTFDADCGKITDRGYGRVSIEKPCITFYAVPANEAVGKTFGIIPKIGCVKLWLFDDLTYLITKGSLPPDFKGVC